MSCSTVSVPVTRVTYRDKFPREMLTFLAHKAHPRILPLSRNTGGRLSWNV